MRKNHFNRWLSYFDRVPDIPKLLHYYVIINTVAVISLLLFVILCSGIAHAEREIASVTTEWKMIGANHRVIVMTYDDPLIEGISCYVSQAKTGGISGSVGLAEDPSNFALSCTRTKSLTIPKEIPKEEHLFTKSTNIWFKSTRVTRIYDKEKNVVVYLAISRHLLDGSPANAISVVPLN